MFFLGAGLSVFVLRRKELQTPRPYRVSGHPITTVMFCACGVFMACSSISYALATEPIALLVSSGILLAGALVYWLTESCYLLSPHEGTTTKKPNPEDLLL